LQLYNENVKERTFFKNVYVKDNIKSLTYTLKNVRSKGAYMTDKQRTTLSLLYRLGSDRSVTFEGNGFVQAGLPWRTDNHPNIEIFKDGYYHDYSDSPEWEKHGISPHGNEKDLEKILGNMMEEEWAVLSYMPTTQESEYRMGRKLNGDIKYGIENGREFLAFKMFDTELRLVGIQRRYIDGLIPKNRMYPGSSSDSIFMAYSPDDPGLDDNYLYILEGATDTFTDYLYNGIAIGVPSTSMLDGAKKYIDTHPEVENLYLCFDNDEAGREATRKLTALYSKNYNINILRHPQNCKDVNDIVCLGGRLVFEEYKERPSRISFIRFNDEPLMYSGCRWGIPEELAPNMKTKTHTADPITCYCAESLGLQAIYDMMELDRDSTFIVVRGL
jgi:hypothetical protein